MEGSVVLGRFRVERCICARPTTSTYLAVDRDRRVAIKAFGAGLFDPMFQRRWERGLEIARALASEPRLLLLDAPAGGLNPTETRTLMDVIRGLRDERGLTIVVVEHDMDLVIGISDRVAVLDHGRKIAEGAPREIVSDAAVVEAYLGSEDDP